jgi:hypothetical protein
MLAVWGADLDEAGLAQWLAAWAGWRTQPATDGWPSTGRSPLWGAGMDSAQCGSIENLDKSRSFPELFP